MRLTPAAKGALLLVGQAVFETIPSMIIMMMIMECLMAHVVDRCPRCRTGVVPNVGMRNSLGN
jgi:hypothetical protein